ncbi:hypothetical protein GCM10010116_26530 [Microbispora rosea subsp. aerata]|nr:hypothetical protein GCM10010116_26530 [Microbispora rosea subsp. aerata]
MGIRFPIRRAVVGPTAYLVAMARIVLTVLGILAALWLVFGFVIPALFATLKFLFVIGIIALVAVVAVTVVGKLSR